MIEKEKMKKILELLGEKHLGMTGTNKAMTFILNDKQVIVEDYGSKSVDEIIKEIKLKLDQ